MIIQLQNAKADLVAVVNKEDETMHTTNRGFLWGATGDKIVIIVILLMMILISYVGHTNITLKQQNQELNEAISENGSVIVTLQKEKEYLSNNVAKLQTENSQLKTEHEDVIVEAQQQIDSIIQSSTPIGGSFKSYTDYRSLSKNSSQWSLQKQAYTDENGLRKIGDSYLVALGSYYGTELGAEYIVTLSNGNTFKVMLCDYKKDIHTDDKNQVTLGDGSILEFYVDASKLPKIARVTGTVGSINFFSGEVISIVRIS